MTPETDYRMQICNIVSEMLDNPDEHGIYGTTRAYDKLEALVSQARAEALEEAAKCLPDTWLDPLLTGPSATIPHDCPSTERFVRALQARIRALKERSDDA